MIELKLQTLDILCGELCAAMLDDEHGDGVDIASGLYGEETTAWIKSVAKKIDELNSKIEKISVALMVAQEAVEVYMDESFIVYMDDKEYDHDAICDLIHEALDVPINI